MTNSEMRAIVVAGAGKLMAVADKLPPEEGRKFLLKLSRELEQEAYRRGAKVTEVINGS